MKLLLACGFLVMALAAIPPLECGKERLLLILWATVVFYRALGQTKL